MVLLVQTFSCLRGRQHLLIKHQLDYEHSLTKMDSRKTQIAFNTAKDILLP